MQRNAASPCSRGHPRASKSVSLPSDLEEQDTPGGGDEWTRKACGWKETACEGETMNVGRVRAGAIRIGVGMLVLSWIVGCSGSEDGADDGSDPELSSSPLWSLCANNGQHCAFTGTHEVRYGVEGNYRTGTFTDGVHCSGGAFGTRSRSNFHCDVLTADPPEMSPMPYVDESAIPTGDPGLSSARIRPTTEAPGGSDGTGAFRTICKFSHMNFDDPIRFPGVDGATHLHAFFGNTETDSTSTQSSIANAGNTTCRGGTANRTAYWVPALLDAQGKPQKPDDGNFYYKTGYAGIAPSTVQNFPAGLRIIAGDQMSQGAQANAWWGCLEYYVPRSPSIVDCGAGNHLMMTVLFPQCWDGVQLDSADHQSHMAYPSNGACPSTHPVPLPEITFNISYPRPASGIAGWHLSSDMYDQSLPGGYSAHADWFDGWDPAISATWVQHCNNAAVDCRSHLLGDGRELYY
jgi:hypothetical protein